MKKMSEIVINLGSSLLERVKSRVCEGDVHRPDVSTGVVKDLESFYYLFEWGRYLLTGNFSREEMSVIIAVNHCREWTWAIPQLIICGGGATCDVQELGPSDIGFYGDFYDVDMKELQSKLPQISDVENLAIAHMCTEYYCKYPKDILARHEYLDEFLPDFTSQTGSNPDADPPRAHV